jgi:hypothetical protein
MFFRGKQAHSLAPFCFSENGARPVRELDPPGAFKIARDRAGASVADSSRDQAKRHFIVIGDEAQRSRFGRRCSINRQARQFVASLSRDGQDLLDRGV